MGFTSADEDEDVAVGQQEVKPAEETKDAENNRRRVSKIYVNDKTIFGTDGFPLSPKEITADNVHVQEGFTRLIHACQIKFIRHDSIENFLFGSDYRPEIKLSIRSVKKAAIDSLNMAEPAAIDFARFIVE